VHPALNPESSGLRTLLRCLSSPGGFTTCNSNVAVPIPKILWNPIVLGLQNFITMLNVETLKLIGIPAIQQANANT
jgi:hypothetical protein